MSDTDCQTPKNDLNRDWPEPAPAPAEWTAQTVSEIAGRSLRFYDGDHSIADAHNAALAAERDYQEAQHSNMIVRLRYQLADAVAALEFYAKSINWDISLAQQDGGNVAANALAKHREAYPEPAPATEQEELLYTEREYQQLREQLAAEREIRTGMEAAMEGAAAAEKQLREQIKPLVEALEEFHAKYREGKP